MAPQAWVNPNLLASRHHDGDTVFAMGCGTVYSLTDSFPQTVRARMLTDFADAIAKRKQRIHPLQLALRWREEIANNSELNMAKIDAREGLSSARITQIMNLLGLPASAFRGLRPCAVRLAGIH
jgi:hypothetical protein